MKLDGKQIANKILQDLKNKVQRLNIKPHLVIILVGNDPASIAYIEQKDLKAEKINARTTIKYLPSDTSQTDLVKTIQQYNNNNNIHGIIVQRPLPTRIDSQAINLAIDPKKDVDGFHPNSNFETPISMAVLKILQNIYVHTLKGKPQFEDWLKNKKIVIVGKGETGGRPILEGFKKIGVKVFVIDSKTSDSSLITKNADIIISAVGKPNVIKPEMIKKGAILVSVGLHKGPDGKLHGDYNEKEIKDKALLYTPTPGGVGPVNVSMLLKNLVLAVGSISSD